jgi:hypothetical protein
MNKSNDTELSTTTRQSRMRRSPVTLVFRPTSDCSELPIRALIDGGLARLIAAKIACELLSNATTESPGHTINVAACTSENKKSP